MVRIIITFANQIIRVQISKSRQFFLQFFEICWRNITASTETFTEKQLKCNFALHFTSYLSIALFKILSNSKTIKTLTNCRYLVKTTLAVNLIFCKLIFFETLIIFVELTIKLITGIFDLQK